MSEITREWIDKKCLDEKVMVDGDDMFTHAVAHRYGFEIVGWTMRPENRVSLSWADLPKLKQLVESYNPNIKLYQGENGCPSALEWTHALAHYSWTEYSQAKWFLRRMAGDRVRGIPSSVFTIIDLRYPNMLQSFGLIRSNLLHQFIYKRPSYYAVQHMAGFFDDTVKPVGLLPHESDGTREITVAGFDQDDASVLLIWQCDEVPGDALQWDPVDLTIQHAKFQDPVYVEMITGKVYELGRSAWKAEGETLTFTKLPVWDSPVMVAERSQVDDCVLEGDGQPRSRFPWLGIHNAYCGIFNVSPSFIAERCA